MDPVGSDAAGIVEACKSLALTGRILNVTATIPAVIGLSKVNEIELLRLPRKASLDAVLSSLKSAGWTQTIIGWTGEVLPTGHKEYLQLRQFNEEDPILPANEFERMDFADGHPPNYYKEFISYKKEWQQIPEIEIKKQHRDKVSELLRTQYEDEIIPVWYGKYTEQTVGSVCLSGNEKAKAQATTSSMLFQTLNQTDRTVGDEYDKEMDWTSYKHLNACVAEAVIKAYQPGDIIWIHTHQHMILVETLRRRLHAAIIIYGQQEPWPTRQVMGKIYNHQKWMTALLYANAIVVPDDIATRDVDRYYMTYQRTVTDIVKHSPLYRQPKLMSGPLGLNPTTIRDNLKDTRVVQNVDFLRVAHGDKKVIMARARVDQLKGMMVVLGAYQFLLRTQPAWKNRVVLVLIVTPDRMPSYQRLGSFCTEHEFVANVAEANSRYGSAAWAPVIYLNGYRPREEYLALLTVADVGIAVNDQEHDNDMSREFVLAQENNCSPLLRAIWTIDQSSERDEKKTFTSKGERIIYGNYIGSRELCDDVYLHDALVMSTSEKQARNQTLLARFTDFPAGYVAEDIVRRLTADLVQRNVTSSPTDLRMDWLTGAYKVATKRLLIFDYDGTLTPIVNNPDDAVPTKALLRSLRKLAGNEKNIVYIISGRSQKFLDQHFGSIKKLGLSAEHGCYVKPHDTEDGEWKDMTIGLDLNWKPMIEAYFRQLEERCPHSWTEKKEVAMVWHYRNALDHDACFELAKRYKEKIDDNVGDRWDLDAMLGKANLEVRPRSLNKGSAVTDLLKILGNVGHGKFVLCAGDDTTDEDMFRSILSWSFPAEFIFTCLVDQVARPTLAQYRAKAPEDVVRGLGVLAKMA